MSSKASSKPVTKLPSFLSLVSDSWAMYRRHTRIFWGLSGWLLIPLVLQVLLQVTLTDTSASFYAQAACTAIFIVLAVWVLNTTILTTDKLHRGSVPSANEQHDLGRRAQRLTIPALLALVLTNIITFGGLLLFIIPGIMFATWFAFSAQEIVLGKFTVMHSLRDSRELVRGRFWAVFGRLWGFDIGVGIVYGIVVVALSAAFGSTMWLTHPDVTPPLGLNLLLGVVEIGLLPLFVVYRTRLYQACKSA